MTNKECLEKARGFIALGWTQQEFARKANGKPVLALDPKATCWCIQGALQAALNKTGNYSERFYECSILLANAADNHALIWWNDAPYRTQAEVLAVFDQAIANA